MSRQRLLLAVTLVVAALVLLPLTAAASLPTLALGGPAAAPAPLIPDTQPSDRSDDSDLVSAQDTAPASITGAASSIEVTKSANPTSLPEPGGPVAFTVRVTNPNAADYLTITSLTDSIHGNLNGAGACSVPQTIPPGGFYQCQFNAWVNGEAGYVETDVVTASGIDDDGYAVSDSDAATVTVIPSPPNITIDPASLSATLNQGDQSQQTLTIGNTGDGDLNWSIAEAAADCANPSDVPWLSESPVSGTTAPAGSNEVEVTMDSFGLAEGTYNAHLCINSNDPEQTQVSVPVTMVVNPPPDTTPPDTTITLDPGAPNGANGWYTSAVQVSVAAVDEDGGSGVSETRCVLDAAGPPAAFDDLPQGCAYAGAGASVGADGEHTLYAASKDGAGNKEAVKNAVFKIDATPPKISLVTPVNQAAYPLGLTVLASYACSDATSTVATCSAPVVSGAALDTAAAGDKSLTVQATDQAGHTASATASYKVLPATPGPVVAWGWNDYGQTDVPDAAKSGVTAGAAGDLHSLALKSDGSVVAWGWNGDNQTSVPPGLGTVSAIAAGAYHSVALRSDGTVAVWGHTAYGEADFPPGLSGVTAIDAGWYHNVALKADGTVAAWGMNMHGQTDVPPGLSGVIAVSAGGNHCLALKSDGGVVAWGDTDFGVNEVPDAAKSGVTAIATGANHSLALKSDGTVVAWGDNTQGQLNVPPGLSGVTAIATAQYHSLALKGDGTVVSWGDNSVGQSTVPPGLHAVTAIAAGGYHNLAIGYPLVAVDDSYSVAANTTLTVPAPGVLANETGSGGDSLGSVLVTYPAHGTLALANDGGFVYTPAHDRVGADSFTYKATAGTVDSNIATVTLNVYGPVPPHVDIYLDVTPDWRVVYLGWSADPINTGGFKVHYSEKPYFQVGDAGVTTDELDAGEWSWADPKGASDPAHNHYYLMQGVGAADLASDPSNRTGVFTFSLTRGPN